MINKIRESLPNEEILFDLSDLFKIFGDSTRIKIISLLFKGEFCVQVISKILEISRSAISHQLRILRQSKLVKYRKEGKIVFYSLNDEHIKNIFNIGLEHIQE
ncbi:ArsR/SmtB family transcription factor [Tepiditoga spiralis]